MYCSLVRSNLHGILLSPSSAHSPNVNKLERIQRRATRFILKSNEPYDVRLSKLNLLTLEQKRFVFDVTSFVIRFCMAISDVESFIEFNS